MEENNKPTRKKERRSRESRPQSRVKDKKTHNFAQDKKSEKNSGKPRRRKRNKPNRRKDSSYSIQKEREGKPVNIQHRQVEGHPSPKPSERPARGAEAPRRDKKFDTAKRKVLQLRKEHSLEEFEDKPRTQVKQSAKPQRQKKSWEEMSLEELQQEVSQIEENIRSTIESIADIKL